MSDNDCEQALERLHGFLDGELTPDRRAEISAHLASCGHCLELYDFEAEIKLSLATRCRDRVPEGLLHRIGELIERDRG